MEVELEGPQSQLAARKEASQLRKNASRPARGRLEARGTRRMTEIGEQAKKERGIEDDPQILHYLGRYEVGIPGMDDNPENGTKSEDRQKNLEERLLRGRLDQPGVQVSTHTDTQRMEYR